MKNASYLILFVLLVSACNGWYEGNRLLSRADNLMYSHPDSAFQLLNHIPENDRARMSEGQRMRYQLLRADAQNKLFVKFTTDSALKEVVAYYNSKGAPDERLILPGFSVFLFRSCPGLRPIEKKILYLTRCSFTTSEMGTLLDKPASTVSSIKARLSENIFGKTSGTKDLEKRLKDVF